MLLLMKFVYARFMQGKSFQSEEFEDIASMFYCRVDWQRS